MLGHRDISHASVTPSFEILCQLFFSLLACCTSYIFFSLLFCYSIYIVMVENVADDGVEPKPAIIEASSDVKPTLQERLKRSTY